VVKLITLSLLVEADNVEEISSRASGVIASLQTEHILPCVPLYLYGTQTFGDVMCSEEYLAYLEEIVASSLKPLGSIKDSKMTSGFCTQPSRRKLQWHRRSTTCEP